MPASYRQELQTQRNAATVGKCALWENARSDAGSESLTNRLSTCPMGRAECVFENRGRVDRVSRQVSKPKSAPVSVNHLRSNAPLAVKSVRSFFRRPEPRTESDSESDYSDASSSG